MTGAVIFYSSRRALHYRWFGSLGMSAYLGRSLLHEVVDFAVQAVGHLTPPSALERVTLR